MNLPLAADARPVPLRSRPDLEMRRMPFRRRPFWNVRDPIAVRYYQLRDEEHFVLTQLDGQTSLAVIRERFNRRFAPRHVDTRQLHALLAMLYREGLVVADQATQDDRLRERQRSLRRRALCGRWSNLLAIRFRGIHPQPVFDRLYPALRWFFTPWCVALGIAWIVAAAMLVWSAWPAVAAQLPAPREFFAAGNLIRLAVALGAAKILHELGHGLTCRHFGGRCRELGVMLLVFTPCLYCDTTDAWMIPSRWRRMAISAAGMYVELLLAATCAVLWWLSEPGWFHSLCFNVMLVCSVATVAFNANPLLRYDGYFMLADWLEIPNLSEQATASWRRWLLDRGAGVESGEPPLQVGATPWLRLYGAASLVYRCLVVAAILWFVHAAAQAHGVEALAQLLAALTVGGMLAMPISNTVRFLRDPRQRRSLRWPRLAASLGVLTVVLGLLFVPLPYPVVAPAVLEPAGAVHVYVSQAGRLQSSVQAADEVAAGDVIARLVDRELDQQIAALESEYAVQQMHVTNLENQQGRDRAGDPTGAGGQLLAARNVLADLRERLRQRRLEQQRLTVTAPAAGTVLPTRVLPAETSAGELAFWSGSPLDARNQGCFLEAGVELCQIGNPSRLEATLVVDQGRVPFVHPGQYVRLRIDELPAGTLTGRVVDVAKLDAEAIPAEIHAKGELPLRPARRAERGESATRPAEASYHVRVRLDDHDFRVPLRSSGRAWIAADSRTLASRLYGWLCRTFRVEL